jgi:hypothetical protein
MPQLLFRNFELLEPSFGELRGGYQLLVEGETIRELSDKPIKAAEAEIDASAARDTARTGSSSHGAEAGVTWCSTRRRIR